MGERITPEQVAAILAAISRKEDFSTLQSAVESGRADSLLAGLGVDRERARQLMSDRETLEKLLNSDEVRALLLRLTGGQGR